MIVGTVVQRLIELLLLVLEIAVIGNARPGAVLARTNRTYFVLPGLPILVYSISFDAKLVVQIEHPAFGEAVLASAVVGVVPHPSGSALVLLVFKQARSIVLALVQIATLAWESFAFFQDVHLLVVFAVVVTFVADAVVFQFIVGVIRWKTVRGACDAFVLFAAFSFVDAVVFAYTNRAGKYYD